MNQLPKKSTRHKKKYEKPNEEQTKQNIKIFELLFCNFYLFCLLKKNTKEVFHKSSSGEVGALQLSLNLTAGGGSSGLGLAFVFHFVRN